jgi:hypothetical protein
MIQLKDLPRMERLHELVAGYTKRLEPQPQYDGSALLTPKQVAGILGVKTHTLAVWRCNKRYNLPYIKVGRLVRYRFSDVKVFVASRTVH